MKNVNLPRLLVLLFVISCAKEEKNIPIFGYSLHNDKIQKLKLNRIQKNNIKYFEYINSNDSIKDLKVIFNPEKDFLLVDMDTFYVTKNRYNSKVLEFKMYQTKENKSHNRTLVFNDTYGLLASLANGADFIFLKDSVSSNDRTIIFKEIFLDLNKIN
ncbi:MAG: hypothetical protein NWQ31_07415 [Polaribacter sp.]|nr:hypothetical protein [Polaribacter sp.]